MQTNDPRLAALTSFFKADKISIVSAEEAFDKAVSQIEDRRHGRNLPLKTCWKKLNYHLNGGLNKGDQVVIGGRPGVGKSAIVNILIRSLFECNPNIRFLCLYFNFEMPAEKQMLRNISPMIKKSVGELLSAGDKIKDEEMKAIKELREDMKRYNLFFVDTPLSISKISNVIKKVSESYPEYILVNVFDHTRLTLSENNEDEFNKINRLSKLGYLYKRKLGCVNIILSQLNRNIENPDRLRTQYAPELSDLFGSDSVSQDADIVIMPHRPELYKIDNYQGLDTKDMIYMHLKKNREGNLGIIPMKHNLKYNIIEELNLLPT